MKILIFSKGFLGDIILLTPVIEALKLGIPGAEVTMVVPPVAAPLVRANPFISDVIIFDRRGEHSGIRGMWAFAKRLRSGRFQRAYSFHRSARTALLLWLAGISDRVGYNDAYLGFLYSRKISRIESEHEVLRGLHLVAGDLDSSTQEKIDRLARGETTTDPAFGRLRLSIPHTEELSDRVREILIDPRPFAVLAPGSAWATKRWTVSGFRDVAGEYLKRGLRVVVVGTGVESDICDAVAADRALINVCGKTSVSDLVAIIAGAQWIVCNDSMATHVASAVGTPCVTIFCATSPTFGFGPWLTRSVVVEKSDLFCKPCRRHGSAVCPTGTEACMRGVKSSQVINAVDALLRPREEI